MSMWHHGSETPYDKPERLISPHYHPLPPVFSCDQCGETRPSKDELRQHRFEAHPLRKPILFLQGRELGHHTTRVTRPLVQDDVHQNDCDRAFLDGREIPVSSVPQELAMLSSGTCQLELIKTGVSAVFKFSFDIASIDDLAGVERRFFDLTRDRHPHQLDSRSIDIFISDTKVFPTVASYVDGICEYLYGLQTKTGRLDVSRPHSEYVNRFNKSVDALAAYKRPVANTIVAAIEFHFNHFSEAAYLVAGQGGLGHAASTYASWALGQSLEPRAEEVPSVDDLEMAIVDDVTKRILRWVGRPLQELSRSSRAIESTLQDHLGTYDGLKMHMLLAEMSFVVEDVAGLIRHVKALRNVAGLETWATSMLSRTSMRGTR